MGQQPLSRAPPTFCRTLVWPSAQSYHRKISTIPSCLTFIKVLIFLLNRTCVEENLPTHRPPTRPEFIPKLEEALQCGYRVLPMHEIWHFLLWYTSLFKTYMDTWLKLKEARCDPMDATTQTTASPNDCLLGALRHLTRSEKH